ncbi:Unannotated [Lentimonas sp. CC19]|nr:Unannotated [Lentimonas sp. CC10]CAA6696075.1 Unannotated [Lentimonas sp. CC19]CAA7071690.1 Unannotated [Lentimonas sp. CC11]
MKIPYTLLCLFLICLCGCQPRNAQESKMYQDFGLRALEGIQTISGDATIPADATSYEITYLKFESGAFIGTGGISRGPVDSSGVDSVKLELLWRKSEDGGAQAVLHSIGSSSRISDEIFTHDYISTHSGTIAHFEDYQIVGYARSLLENESPEDKLNSANVSPELSHAISHHQYVVAIGVEFSNDKNTH